MKKILLISLLLLLTGCSSSNNLKLKEVVLVKEDSIDIVFNKMSTDYVANIRFENDSDRYKWKFGTDIDPNEKGSFVSRDGKTLENIWIEDPTSGNIQLVIKEKNDKEEITDLYFISFDKNSICISKNNNSNCEISVDIKTD